MLHSVSVVIHNVLCGQHHDKTRPKKHALASSYKNMSFLPVIMQVAILLSLIYIRHTCHKGYSTQGYMVFFQSQPLSSEIPIAMETYWQCTMHQVLLSKLCELYKITHIAMTALQIGMVVPPCPPFCDAYITQQSIILLTKLKYSPCRGV